MLSLTVRMAYSFLGKVRSVHVQIYAQNKDVKLLLVVVLYFYFQNLNSVCLDSAGERLFHNFSN